jgi:hypothetical protein
MHHPIADFFFTLVIGALVPVVVVYLNTTK